MFLLFWFWWTFVYKSLGVIYFHFSGVCLGEELLGRVLSPCLIIWGATRLFSRVPILFIFSPAVVFHFRHLPWYFVIVCLFDYSFCYQSEWYFLLVWTCISLMANDLEHLLMCLLTIRMYIFFEEMSIQIFCLFDNWVFVFLAYDWQKFSSIPWVVISLSGWCPLKHKIFNFDKVQVVYFFSFVICTFAVTSMKSFA